MNIVVALIQSARGLGEIRKSYKHPDRVRLPARGQHLGVAQLAQSTRSGTERLQVHSGLRPPWAFGSNPAAQTTEGEFVRDEARSEGDARCEGGVGFESLHFRHGESVEPALDAVLKTDGARAACVWFDSTSLLSMETESIKDRASFEKSARRESGVGCESSVFRPRKVNRRWLRARLLPGACPALGHDVRVVRLPLLSLIGAEFH